LDSFAICLVAVTFQRQMRGQVRMDNAPHFLQVERDGPTVSRDVTSERSSRQLWVGSGLAALLITGVVLGGFLPSAWDASQKHSHLTPTVIDEQTAMAAKNIQATMVRDEFLFNLPQPMRHPGSGSGHNTNLRPSGRVVLPSTSKRYASQPHRAGQISGISMSNGLTGFEKDEVAKGTTAVPRRSVLRLAGLFGALAAATTPTQGAGAAQDTGTKVISDSSSEKLAVIEDAMVEMFQNVGQSVCNIITEERQGGGGQGSGFVWDKKGHIVTNFHGVNKAESASVCVIQLDGSKKEYSAKLTGVDPDTDIAVLKIDAPESELQVLPIGDSSKVRAGQLAFAFGDPFGLDLSFSTGVISGKNREMEAMTGNTISGVLQTDAAVNPGNSGGPLLDSKGRVIGINTAVVGSIGSGVGFAVPINLALPSIKQLIEFGATQRGILGIAFAEAGDNRTGPPAVEKGIVVMSVPKGSPAEAAGLIAAKTPADPFASGAKYTVGDVIIAINDDEIKGLDDLRNSLSKYKAGDKVEVKVLRGSAQESKSLQFKLGAFRMSTFAKMDPDVSPGLAS